MRSFNVHILVGLSGSGKTYFAKSHMYDQFDYHIEVDEYRLTNKGIDGILKDFFNMNGLDIQRECGAWDSNRPTVFDSLTLTNEDVHKVIELFIKYTKDFKWNCSTDYRKYETLKVPVKFFIHQWNEDREACLKNDLFRLESNEFSRTEGAQNTIRYAKYEKIDMDALKAAFPDYEFEYIEHTVEVHSQKDLILDYYGDKITSDQWCIGGDRRDCWGHHIIFDDEEEPVEFTKFDNIINHFCPNISRRDYRLLWDACVEEETEDDADYYGGCMSYKYYVCDLNYLFDKMEEMGIIENY